LLAFTGISWFVVNAIILAIEKDFFDTVKINSFNLSWDPFMFVRFSMFCK
jgi:hypothetical protein